MCLPSAALAQEHALPAERALFQAANRERTARGLPPLKWDERLASAARPHALLMAERNSMSHQFPGEPDLAQRATQAGARFTTIAENVAVAQSVTSLHTGWMKSPPHRANLLDADSDSIGIAVAERNGHLFAVQDFSRGVPNLTLEEQEREVGAVLRARGLRLGENVSDARQTCALDHGVAGSHPPLYMVRYETVGLGDLPDLLTQKLRSGRFHTATVGACSARNQAGFVNFRLAVLLY
jgi:hypothetical protein